MEDTAAIAPDILRVAVDPRVELAATLELLSLGNPCDRGEESAYLGRVRDAFGAYRDHEACRLTARMRPEDWRHRPAALIALDFTPAPALEVRTNFDHYRSLPAADPILLWAAAVRDFAARSAFMDFIASEKPFHEALVARELPRFSAMDYRAVEGYLGVRTAYRYHIVLAPLYHGFSPHNILFKREDGSYGIYSVNGHSWVRGGTPEFDFETHAFAHNAWHEIAHSIVDPVTEDFAEALRPMAPLYSMMTGHADRGPGGWLRCVNEHVIRAMTSRLDALALGESRGLESVELEKKWGFKYAGLFYEALLEYEKSRDRCPTVREFYPAIVEMLRKLYRGLAPVAAWKKI